MSIPFSSANFLARGDAFILPLFEEAEVAVAEVVEAPVAEVVVEAPVAEVVVAEAPVAEVVVEAPVVAEVATKVVTEA